MERSWLSAYAPRGRPEGTSLTVRLQPGASRRGVTLEGDSLKLRVTSPAHEERANQDCIAYLSELLGMAKSSITIARGRHARSKTVVVSGMLPQEVEERIRSWLEV